jgi:phosphopantetheinyl transferase
MGNIPPLDQPLRLPVHIPTPAYLMDHHFQGRPVLPAVEAMEALAQAVKNKFPRLMTDCLTDARFEKFIYMDPDADQLEAVVELQDFGKGLVHTTLLTRTKTLKTAFARTKIHARLSFEQAVAASCSWPLDLAAVVEGPCTIITPELIYKDLVPFGPAFRNISAPLCIGPDGALVCIGTPGPQCHNRGATVLGSPYALDAAFHAACVWAQHYRGIVAFPVAVERRRIIRPTCPDRRYFGRIIPKTVSTGLLRFDMILLDGNGQVCELAQGVHMRDVSGGRLLPPTWIRPKNRPDPLANLRQACLAMTVVELDTMADFAAETLTPLEKERYRCLGQHRRKSYLGARLALKRLFRRCHGDDLTTPSHHIETVRKHSPLPWIGQKDAGPCWRCSVSHDRRFAIAVAHHRAIGVDVEVISPKVLKCRGLFMTTAERKLVHHAGMDAKETAVRIWTIKEAAAKATRMNLAEAWSRVQVTSIGETQSRLVLDTETITAHHAVVDDHLFSVISLSRNSSK